MKMIITPTGEIRHIYTDKLRGLAKHGEAETTRASNVEPTADGKWEADMSPCQGPILDNGGKGFDTRQAALDAETEWLEKNHIPKPGK